MAMFHRSRGPRKGADCSAIFVHAGAGYHSIQNESIHLRACNDAAAAAMTLLRNGGSAVDAVEMAIKVLEDREITNAGYGSNLAIDGTVEGDAVIVDHLGRSGGVGAVAQIKNPISLARTILDQTTKELTLRRVPPNLLVGQGATDFAYEQNMAILPNDALVSAAARDRWYRWKQDLKAAERKAAKAGRTGSDTTTGLPSNDTPPRYEDLVRTNLNNEHAKAIKASVWNEGQAVSPPPTTPNSRPASNGAASGSRLSSFDSRLTTEMPGTPISEDDSGPLHNNGQRAALTAENLAYNSPPPSTRSSVSAMRRVSHPQDAARDQDAGLGDHTNMSDIDDGEAADTFQHRHTTRSRLAWNDGTVLSDAESDASSTLTLPSITPSPPGSHVGEEDMDVGPETSGPRSSVESLLDDEPQSTDLPTAYSPNDQDPGRKDCVTDTVGAIAIDSEGNIACGASSGGIGMKYRGRIGPAALVGVGAAVVPLDADDKNGTCTGAVTSGTGEHMGTTLAASVCAERLYHGLRKVQGGGYEPCEDDQAIRSMIETDFMGHPSVKHSHSTGAIGVLAVKKTATGAYLYFAHNTDSFALASMHADEPKPTCTMSRSHGNGMVAAGGRAIRYRRKW